MRLRQRQYQGACLGAVLLFALSVFGGNSWIFCLLMATGGGLSGFFLPFLWALRVRKKETRMITMDMADYLTSVSLLMTAGLTLWDALRRGLWGCNLRRPLFREISVAFDAYDQGNTLDQVEAFEEMAMRCRIPVVSTFVCALVQNYKKGSGEIAPLFMELAGTCRNERRTLASKLADEATTLLLIPSTLALIVMVLVLTAPAILQLIQL